MYCIGCRIIYLLYLVLTYKRLLEKAARIPFRFRKETFGSKKPSKEARKGTFEGQVVAGASREIMWMTEGVDDL